MRIDVVCVGSIKEKFYKDAVEEYKKRLSRYCEIRILEACDEKTPDGASDLENESIKKKEAKRILEKIHATSFVIVLAIEGRKMDSVALSKLMEKAEVDGRGHITLVIGGSLGLDKQVMDRAHYLLSFSDMTFPHPLMRVILLEQIYRSFRIRRNEPYHK